MAKYRNSATWFLPLGNMGMKAVLTDSQMKDVVDNYLSNKPIPNIRYTGGGFAGMDPRVTVQNFYSKDQILKMYNEERPKVPTKKVPATIFGQQPYKPTPTQKITLKQLGIIP
jgi:hypothetical protein